MLIVQTPFRMSFFGGGTDIPDYFNEYGGSVLSSTFDKYCYHIIRDFPPFFEHQNQFTYSKIERFNNPNEVEHPAVREALIHMNLKNVHIVYDSDLPARSGLGTSSSFAVGLLNGLHSLKGEVIDKMTLAKEAIYLERGLCNEPGGVQDQLAVAFGGLNHMTFNSSEYNVRSVTISEERKQNFNDHLMLFFTGFSKCSDEIAAEQVKNISLKSLQLQEIAKLVNEGEKILVGKSDLCDFGRLLDYTWQLKRSLNDNISSCSIDEIYSKARKAGAIGGKLLGSGGGGFMLFFVEPDRQQKVKDALSNLLYIPFKFETIGTKLIYCEPATKGLLSLQTKI